MLTFFEKLPPPLRARHERYVALASRFADRHRLPAEIGVAKGGAFEFDGVAMSLGYDPLVRPRHATIAVDFGPPDERGTAAMRALLEANFAGVGSDVVRTIAPHTGHVVCFASIELDGLDVDGLERVLGELAAAARRGPD